jgi:hypothetical protein
MVDNAPVTGLEFDRGYPGVVFEVSWDGEIEVRVRRLHLDEIVAGNGNDDIRLADPPAVDEMRRSRQILPVTLPAAAINPCLDCGDLYLSQAPIVGELSITRVRVPRRHLAAEYGLPHRFGPWADFFVGD